MRTNATSVVANAVLALLLMAGAGVVHAEGRCPPGMFPTGGGNAGWEGCAPMGPGESEDEWEAAPAWRRLTPEEQADYDAYLREGREAYDRMHNGAWEYRRLAGPQGGMICEARFSKMGESVALRAAPGHDGGAVLTFRGKKVPHPRQPKPLKVTLLQGGDAGRTVEAYSYKQPDVDAYYDGALSFTLPSVEAMLSSMADAQPFKVKYRGRTLVDLQWHHGRDARAALAQCLGGR